MTRIVNSRIRLLLASILVAFVGLLAREAWIATVRAAPLAAMAQAQTKATIPLPAARGTIFDAVGTPLALGEQATTVYVDPTAVTHPRTEAIAAARILGLKRTAVLRALTTTGTHFAYVERKAPADKASLLAKRNLAGFHFYGEERRTYPQGSVAAQVLGFAGVDNNGLAGLELELNGQLTGTPGKETIVRDPFGRAIDVQSNVPAKPGQGRVPHDRPPHPGERRAGAARDGGQVPREGRDGDRHRPAHRRGARDGDRSRATTRTTSRTSRRRSRRTTPLRRVRAGIASSRSSPSAARSPSISSRRRRRSRSRTRSTSPTASCTTRRSGRPSG